MDERKPFCDAVDEMMDELTERLHTVIHGLITKLQSHFTEGELQEIDANETNIKKVKRFFTALKTKNVDTYEKCLVAIKDLKHPDVAECLTEKWKTNQLQSAVRSPSKKGVYILIYHA